MLGVEKSKALNFRDYQTGGVFSHNNKETMKSELSKFVDETYDYVFSHGLEEWNEYGHHDNHQEVGIIASEIAEERSWQLIRFCYNPIYGSGTATVAYKENADYYYQLNYEDLRFKLELINCFPYEMESLKNTRALHHNCARVVICFFISVFLSISECYPCTTDMHLHASQGTSVLP